MQSSFASLSTSRRLLICPLWKGLKLPPKIPIRRPEPTSALAFFGDAVLAATFFEVVATFLGATATFFEEVFALLAPTLLADVLFAFFFVVFILENHPSQFIH